MFKQIEYAGVLKNADNPNLAGKFIDFLLSSDAQAAFPDYMGVFPANEDAPVTEAFTKFGSVDVDTAEFDARRHRRASRRVDQRLDECRTSLVVQRGVNRTFQLSGINGDGVAAGSAAAVPPAVPVLPASGDPSRIVRAFRVEP